MFTPAVSARKTATSLMSLVPQFRNSVPPKALIKVAAPILRFHA